MADTLSKICAGSSKVPIARLSSHARKRYLRLARSDSRLFERVDRALDRVTRDPTLGKPLAGPLSGHRSLRVGTHRIIYRFDAPSQTPLILDIASRGGAYR